MEKLKVGDIVDYHRIIGGEITSRNHEILEIYLKKDAKTAGGYCFQRDIAKISGKAGVVDLKALTKSSEKKKELDYHFDLFFDIKTEEQLQHEVEYLASRLSTMMDLCRRSGRPIDKYVFTELGISKRKRLNTIQLKGKPQCSI
jgi:hypothetical protein